MKKLRILTALAAVALSLGAYADCQLNLSVMTVPGPENVPAGADNYLDARLQNLVSTDGIVADPGLSNFFIAGKFSHIYAQELAGPPRQTALHTSLTLYIGDVTSETVYSSTTVELRGVGDSEQRAFINALKQVNANNSAIKSFIRSGKTKVVDYFNKNYRQIIAKADKAASQNKYDEAVWLLNMVPECCVGYNEVSSDLNRYYTLYLNREGNILLDKAKAAWATSPDVDGAQEAFSYLSQIDPESSAYSGAQKLLAEIKASVKSDRDFELREKYHDQIDLEKARVQAIREIGVAYGKGQQPTTTNVMWLR